MFIEKEIINVCILQFLFDKNKKFLLLKKNEIINQILFILFYKSKNN